jgi:hypothetical protein
MRAGLQLEGYAACNGQSCYVDGIGLVEDKQRSQPFVIIPGWKTFFASFVPMWFNCVVP